MADEVTAVGQRVQPTRQALVDSALQRFAAVGFNRARLTDISADAGVTTGAFYRHFAGKDDLFRVLLAEFDQEVTRVLGDAESLRTGCQRWLEICEASPGVVRAGAELTKAGSAIAQERSRVREGWIALIARLLPSGLDLRTARVAAQLVVDTVDYYAYTVVMGWAERGRAERVGRTVEHLVQQGLYRS